MYKLRNNNVYLIHAWYLKFSKVTAQPEEFLMKIIISARIMVSSYTKKKENPA